MVLSATQRQQIVPALLVGCTWENKKPKLARQAMSNVAKAFNVHRSTVTRVWQRALSNYEKHGRLTAEGYHHKKGNKCLYDKYELAKSIQELPADQRSTHKIAKALGISQGTAHMAMHFLKDLQKGERKKRVDKQSADQRSPLQEGDNNNSNNQKTEQLKQRKDNNNKNVDKEENEEARGGESQAEPLEEDTERKQQQQPAAGKKKAKLFLSAEQRQQIVPALLVGCTWENKKPKLARQAMTNVAKAFNVHRSTVTRVWQRAQSNYEKRGKLTAEGYHYRKGRPCLYDKYELARSIQEVPRDQRSTQKIAKALGVSKGTAHTAMHVFKDLQKEEQRQIKELAEQLKEWEEQENRELEELTSLLQELERNKTRFEG